MLDFSEIFPLFLLTNNSRMYRTSKPEEYFVWEYIHNSDKKIIYHRNDNIGMNHAWIPTQESIMAKDWFMQC